MLRKPEFCDHYFAATTPQSYNDALNSKQRDNWQRLLNKSCGAANSDGDIVRYTVLLVAKGTKRGISYDKTFKPVVRYDSILAIALEMVNWEKYIAWSVTCYWRQ